jgi:hypothetical protein
MDVRAPRRCANAAWRTKLYSNICRWFDYERFHAVFIIVNARKVPSPCFMMAQPGEAAGLSECVFLIG